MDSVAQSIIDVAQSQDSPRVLNIVHPRPIAFNDLIASVNNSLSAEGVISNPLPALPIQEWFSLLEARAAAPTDADIKEVVGGLSIHYGMKVDLFAPSLIACYQTFRILPLLFYCRPRPSHRR